MVNKTVKRKGNQVDRVSSVPLMLKSKLFRKTRRSVRVSVCESDLLLGSTLYDSDFVISE